jgi:hypothetical protein
MRNLMKSLICLILIFLKVDIYSQKLDSLDFKYFIEKITNDSSSIFFYPRLIEKVKNNPSAIDNTDCYYLYYGQIFRKNYKPFLIITSPEYKSFVKATTIGNCKKVLQLGPILLEKNPVDLTTLLHVSICIKNMKNADTTYFFQQRFKYLLDAILSTGDGKSIATAIRIVDVEDDYVLKGVLGFIGGVENLSFEKNHAYSIWEKRDQKLYFEDVINP